MIMTTETTNALAGISDKDLVNMIYRALVVGCRDGECYQEYAGSDLTIQGLVNLETVADCLRLGIKGEEIKPWIGDDPIPPYQGE
jgi:hypothetical protein